MKLTTAVCALASILCSPLAVGDSLYGSIKLGSSTQNLNSSELKGSGVTGRLNDPALQRNALSGFALGYSLSQAWRFEGEYSAPQKSGFKTRWAPHDSTLNNQQVDSQRLMLNGYRDFHLSQAFSLYGTLGMGVAFIESNGYQGSHDRKFTRNDQTNMAYSAGLGANYKLSEKVTLGGGYRYVYMGQVETGRNSFANALGARDEQLKGRLGERDIFMEARYSF